MNAEEQPDPMPGDEPNLPPRRRRRAQELWARETEPYAGALVLCDLEEAGDEDVATILARFAVAGFITAAARGGHAELQRARRSARQYLRHAPPEVRRPLARLLSERARAPRPFYLALRAVGLQAAAAGHAGGAYTFLRLAYEVAIAAAQPLPAARVAAHLARHAAQDDAPYSARCWTARVHTLLGAAARRPRSLPPGAAAPTQVPAVPRGAYVAGMTEPEDRGPTLGGGYDAAERRALQAALQAGTPLICPACGAPLAVSDVPQPAAVSYVRRRVWVLCTGCRRTASLDRT
jgi:hypothetical protein